MNDAFWRTMLADRLHRDKQSPRRCSPADIQSLQTFLEESRCRIAEQSHAAVVGLNDTMTSHIAACVDRRLFWTDSGFLGVAPRSCQIGDQIFVLTYGPAPVVLRRHNDARNCSKYYTTLGHCYVDGIMDGEAVKMDLARLRVAVR